MARRYYSSTATATTLTGAVTAGATTLPVASTVGWPTLYPFTLIVDDGTASEEVVTVTNVAGLNVTVTRGADGTAAASHSAGAAVRHGVSARDFDEPNAHIQEGDGDNPHGLPDSAWDTGEPVAYTPAWTNITVGNGTSSGSYVRIGDLVFVSARLVFGSTTTASASPVSVTLPVTPAAFQQSISGGFSYFGGAAWGGVQAKVDASTLSAELRVPGTSATSSPQFTASLFGGTSVVNVAGNILSISGVYLAA